ncbi:MAG: DUF86 domain-containing protein [Elusimicrobiota bacterium]
MSKRHDIDFIQDIKQSIENIFDYIGKMNYEEFLNDKKTKDAVVHNLEIIGEATKNISEILKTNHSYIPWKQLAGIRDKIAYFYFGIDYKIVWNIMKKQLPILHNDMEKIERRELFDDINGK